MARKRQKSKFNNNERSDMPTKEEAIAVKLGLKIKKQRKMDILEREKGELREKDMAALAMMKRLENEKRQNMKKCEVGRHTVCFTAGTEYKVKVLEKQY